MKSDDVPLHAAFSCSWILISFLAVTVPAEAQHDLMDTDWPKAYTEAFAGYQVASGWLENDFTYGLRAGYNFRRFGFQITYEKIDSILRSSVLPQGFTGEVDAEFEFYDLSLVGYFMTRSHYKLLLYAGPGYAELDVDGFPGSPANNPAGDTFTLHAGVGSRAFLYRQLYLRPDFLVRWLEEKDDFRFSVTLAVGVGSKQDRPSRRRKPNCSGLRWEYREVGPQAEGLAKRIGTAINTEQTNVDKLSSMYERAHQCVDDLEKLVRHFARCSDRGAVSAKAIEETTEMLRGATDNLGAYAVRNRIRLKTAQSNSENEVN